jgi:type II secretory pathway pseudopilin PulG
MRRRGALRWQGGFTYVGLLFAIAILGITLSTVGVLWSTQIRRDKEAQLLWVGDQYRQAIGRYRNGTGRLPMALQDLLTDEQAQVPRHFIRQLYPDPMTGQADWQVIEGPGGGVLGVASTSPDKPIKVANFPSQYQEFEKAETYSDWKFVFKPGVSRHRRLIRPTGTP